MEAWVAVILSFGSSALLLTVLGYLGKSLLAKLIDRDTKRYESELKASSDAAIERIRNDLVRSVESYKIQLKKSEFLFEREFAAASALVEYHEEIMPISLHPNMHMDDVYEHIACSLESVEIWIKLYVAKHGAILPKTVSVELMMAARKAGENKFDIGPDPENISKAAFKAGEDIYNRVREARDIMCAKVWGQSST